jgi:hypothetical protein
VVPPILRNRARLSNRSPRTRTGNHALPRANPPPGSPRHRNLTCRGRDHTTGFTHDELIDICVRITAVERDPDAAKWPPCLGLLNSVAATLAYLRHNRTQSEIGESLGVSQPTVCRAITVITPLISAALTEYVPTADELDPETQYIVDGTLLPCWSWAGHKELYSGKHKTTGMNVQVACMIYGKLAWISDPVNGSRHDNYCLGESDVLRTLNPKNWMGDKGGKHSGPSCCVMSCRAA